VLPNLIFAVARHFIFITRPLINLDYIALNLGLLFIPRLAVGGLYCILLVCDLIVSLAMVYHFRQTDVLASLKYLLYLNPKISVPILITIIAGSGATAVAALSLSGCHKSQMRLRALVSVALGLLIFAADCINGSNGFFGISNHTLTSANISGSTIATITKQIVGDAFKRDDISNVNRTERRMDSATGQLLFDSGRLNRPSVSGKHLVLVIVESLGLFVDSRRNDFMFSPFMSPQVDKRYKVDMGSTRFRGSTTPAEFRELCNLEINYTNASTDVFRQSLAKYLRQEGFHTIAMHGFTGKFFSRLDWYPRLGFERILFAEDIVANRYTFHYCGSMIRGICDADMAQIVKQELLAASGGERKFIYWLTLNSHLPVERVVEPDLPSDIKKDSELNRHSDLLSFLRLLDRVNQSILDVALNPDLQPTQFIIVGDHAPPLYLKEERMLFDPDRVPFIQLTPRLAWH
jgi:phosphoglycerol transferase MdoB-like AlkP superfamily enzyme